MASLVLAPTTGPVGTTVSVKGTGFGNRVTVRLYFNRAEVSRFRCGRYGTFTKSVTVPSNVGSGDHSVKAMTSSGEASAPFKVPSVVEPPPPENGYLIMPRAELMARPASGPAWDYIVKVASGIWPAPELDDQDNKVGVMALAAALVYARTGDAAMRTKAQNAIAAMIPTYDFSEDTGLGPIRQLAGWVLAADFIGLTGATDDAFRALLQRALTSAVGSHPRWGKSLTITHDDSNNNWGAFAGASRIAALLYLGEDVTPAANTLRGFLGERDKWAGFRGQGAKNVALYANERTWACDASASGFVPVNGPCVKSGINLDGAIVGDIYRTDLVEGQPLTWPPSAEGRSYILESLQGLIVQAELLYRNGHPTIWQAGNGAMKRIGDLLTRANGWNYSSVSYHVPWLLNKRLGTTYPKLSGGYGRAFGFADCLYG